jgi:O-antigen/teichoic acid export membrane protein
MFFFPALSVLISVQRAILVSDKNTKPVTMGTITEFLIIVVTLTILISYLDLVGAVAATISFVAGRMAANIYLMSSTSRSLKYFT